ncbi:MAG: hypothetical protein ACKVQA_17610 [Burkholderiales bacterium]
MKKNSKFWVPALLWCTAFVLASCATIIKGGKQEIHVATDPSGAQCELKRNGQVLGVVNPTPGSVSVSKGADSIEVACTKDGHLPGTEYISSSFNSVTFGNLIIGGLVGVVVDASSGANYDYATDVYVKLAPKEFQSAEQRDSYFDAWRSELLQDATRAKAAITKQCKGANCADLEKQAENQVQAVMAEIEVARTETAIKTPPSSPATPVSRETPPDPGAIGKGTKWKYRVLDRGRQVGTLVIEARDVSRDAITERITQEGSKAFQVERTVGASNRMDSFQATVVLPGGSQYLELAPYFSADPTDPIGKTWRDLPAELYVRALGTQRLSMEVRLAAREAVVVPAGTFDTIRYEAQSPSINNPGGDFKLKCTYWYAPRAKRTVKMEIAVLSSNDMKIGSKDIYELTSYEPVR